MIVKCVKIMGDLVHESLETEGDGRFVVGNYYYVLGMIAKGGQEPDLILRAHEGSIPVLAPIQNFETYTGYLPPNWIVWHTLEHGLYMQPHAWLEKDLFWEDYYQGNYVSQRLFTREVRIIVESEPAPREILPLLIYPIPHYKDRHEPDYALRLWDNFF